MRTFRDRLDRLADAGASLYGISIDTPFSLGEFAEQNELTFPLVSDTNKEIIDAYDVAMDFDDLGITGVAKRSVFVVDDEGTITYAWVSDDPGVEPDYEEVERAAADAA
jgi:peroxiredoxin